MIDSIEPIDFFEWKDRARYLARFPVSIFDNDAHIEYRTYSYSKFRPFLVHAFKAPYE